MEMETDWRGILGWQRERRWMEDLARLIIHVVRSGPIRMITEQTHQPGEFVGRMSHFAWSHDVICDVCSTRYLRSSECLASGPA